MNQPRGTGDAAAGPMSRDQNATNPAELQRIKAAIGGMTVSFKITSLSDHPTVFKDNKLDDGLEGQLSVYRAIGDVTYKVRDSRVAEDYPIGIVLSTPEVRDVKTRACSCVVAAFLYHCRKSCSRVSTSLLYLGVTAFLIMTMTQHSLHKYLTTREIAMLVK
jgi:hypothetical protein